jgi:hypothetical protein
MKKLLYSILLAFCLFLKVQAQPLLQYSNTYSYPGTGSEFGISIAYDDLGNAYVTGTTDANGNNDIITIKYSPNGTKLWEAIYSGTGNGDDKPVKVITKNNKVYVTGYTRGSGTGYDWVTICYNATGSGTQPSNWVAIYNDANNGDDKATDIETDNAGNIYVSGTTYNNVSGKSDALLLKYNSIGIKIRNLTKNDNNYNLTSYDIAINSSNQIFFSTSSITYTGNNYIYTLDTAFNQIASDYPSGGNSYHINKIIPYGLYFYALMSYGRYSELHKVQVGSNSATWREDFSWQSLYPYYGYATDFDLDVSGNPYVLYYDTSSRSEIIQNYKLIKLDGTTHDSMYTRIFDPTNQIDRPFKIKVGRQGTPIIYVTGNTLKDGKLQNYTTGYNSNTGTALWTLNQSCTNTGDKSLVDLQLDNYNNIYMTGSSNCGGNDDMLIVKYCASLPVANAGIDKSVCAGSTVQIGSTALPNYLYSWSPATGLSNAAISNPTASSNATYILTVTSPSGCSANDTVTVTVNPLPNTPTITQRNDTLFSSVTGTTYSWYKGAALVGTSAIYKLTSTGNYTLKITNGNGCTSLVSNTLIVSTITAVRNTSSIINSFSVYPNPASQNLNINIQSKQNANAQLRIFDLSGKEMFTNDIKITKGEMLQKIDVSKFAKGIYVIQLTDEDGISIDKFVVE